MCPGKDFYAELYKKVHCCPGKYLKSEQNALLLSVCGDFDNTQLTFYSSPPRHQGSKLHKFILLI